MGDRPVAPTNDIFNGFIIGIPRRYTPRNDIKESHHSERRKPKEKSKTVEEM
jgi:hypothetical protein